MTSDAVLESRRRPSRQRRRRPASVVFAVCVLSTTGVVACGIEPGSGACTETAIVAQPVSVRQPTAPLILTAMLTRRDGGVPVAGAELTFFVRLEKVGKSGVAGVHVGEATTDASGTARFERSDGLDGVGFSDEKVTGYSVEYNPMAKIDDVQYCRSRTDAPVTVS